MIRYKRGGVHFVAKHSDDRVVVQGEHHVAAIERFIAQTKRTIKPRRKSKTTIIVSGTKGTPPLLKKQRKSRNVWGVPRYKASAKNKALVAEVLKQKSFFAPYGDLREAWEKVAAELNKTSLFANFKQPTRLPESSQISPKVLGRKKTRDVPSSVESQWMGHYARGPHQSPHSSDGREGREETE